jgi:Uma2 family endonuclease
MDAPLLSRPEPIDYPDSDGQPLAENTLQYEYIVTIKGGLDGLFRDDPNVFVAGDLFWYPVEGNNKLREAPDVLVVFGRPKEHRASYRQWVEGGIAPQVVFEIFSPGNRLNEMIRKFKFYERYGVEEYYIYNPENGDLVGYQRQGDKLVEILFMDGWSSPRLGVRFQIVDQKLEIYRPDGRKFASYVELEQQGEHARHEAEEQKERADREQQRAEQQQQRAERLLAQPKALGVDPDA